MDKIVLSTSKPVSVRPVKNDIIRPRSIVMQINSMPHIRLDISFDTATPIERLDRHTVRPKQARAITRAEDQVRLPSQVKHRPGKIRGVDG